MFNYKNIFYCSAFCLQTHSLVLKNATMIKRQQFKEHLKALKQQKQDLKMELEIKQRDIEEQIKAIHVLLGKKQYRNRSGIHLKIKELIKNEGPQSLSELTDKLHSNLSSQQPRATIYYALKRRIQDFYQGENQKWHLKDEKNDFEKDNEIDDFIELEKNSKISDFIKLGKDKKKEDNWLDRY